MNAMLSITANSAPPVSLLFAAAARPRPPAE